MDSQSVPIPMDPVAPADMTKSRDVAPGKKRNDQAEGKEAAAASAALTVSFAEILQSKRQDLKVDTEGQIKNEPAAKGKKLGHKTAEERTFLVKGQSKALKEEAAAAAAESVAKTISEKNTDSLQSSELPKKGALTAAEEAQLKEMVQKNGAMSGRKDTTAQMKGSINGETLNRPDGIGAVKSMTANEGEVLKNLSNGDETQGPQKLKIGKPGKAKQASALRDVSEGEEKTSPSTLSADKIKQEFANLMENAQEKITSTGPSKKQSIQKDLGVENREVFPARGDVAAPVQGKSAGVTSAVKPQVVISQVVNGAIETLRDGTGRAVLNLQPPRLGTLDLDVAVKDNRVTMIMLADNQEVKQMLQSGMEDLRNALQDKGFQIDRLEVLVQNRPDESGSNFWQQAGFAQGESSGSERPRGEPEAVPAARENPMRAVRTGENGISIFA
ncbi:MAG TPA: flagellar hook-length control protein FliK [Syntrophales bacterium]|nr:flagellar hook-length control protein FliK [Syntrophales bacterium]